MAINIERDPKQLEKNAFQVEASPSSVFGASFKSALFEGPFADAFKTKVLDDLNKSDPLLPPEQLNKSFPGLNADKPISERAAKFIMRDREIRDGYKKTMATAPDTIFSGKIVPLAGAIAGSLADPINLSIGGALALTSGGTAAGLAPKLARLGIIFENPTVAKNVATFGVNMVENVIAESAFTPLKMKLKEEEFEDFNAVDHLKHVLFSSAAITGGIQLGIGGTTAIWSKLGKKYTDAPYKATELGMNADKNPSEALSIYDAHIKQDISMDDSVQMALAETIGPKIEGIEKSADINDMFKTIESSVREGKISLDDVQDFRGALKANGFDDARFKYAQDDADLDLPKTTKDQIAESLNSRKNEIGYNEKSAKLLETQESHNPDVLSEAAQLSNTVKTREADIQTRLDEGLLTENQATIFKDMQKKSVRHEDLASAYEEFSNCILGAVSGE